MTGRDSRTYEPGSWVNHISPLSPEFDQQARASARADARRRQADQQQHNQANRPPEPGRP